MTRSYTTICDDIDALFLDSGSPDKTCPIYIARDGALPAGLTADQESWLEATDFKVKAGEYALLPGNGSLSGVIIAADTAEDGQLYIGKLPSVLPVGAYHIEGDADDAELAAVSWALGHYTFRYYKSEQANGIRKLRLPDGVSRDGVINIAAANWLARNLINTPSNDLGPAELEASARDLADHFGAEFAAIVGDDLLAQNFPLIHAVGRASPREPRLIDLSWGAPDAPKVTLVGKGICFDTGGLNLKLGTYMTLMKKDMGGSAAALALAAMIMGAKLPVRLRLLIASAENAVSGNAFRPGDVIKSRAGLTVEIGNTDAEGRLVLADALALADEDAPGHVFSFATLTGAARVALGADLAPVYSTDSELANALVAKGMSIEDPMWPMPFWTPYDKMLKSRTADLNNISQSGFAGSILAALFLKRFVKDAGRYTHFDIYGWVGKAKAGKPAGGEPHCARAVFAYLKGAFPQR